MHNHRREGDWCAIQAKWFGILLCLFITFEAAAQRRKDGTRVVNGANNIVNEFTVLTADASAGDLFVKVLNSGLNANGRFSGPLAPGDLVMIIQMQGATIDGTPNDSTWGRVLSYNNCGNYEFKEVLSVPDATTITFACPLVYDYTAAGRVQVIRVPRYNNLTVNNNGVLTTENWNGATGGVLAVEVGNNAVINNGGVIDVTGKGFRGGALDNLTGWNVTGFSSASSNDGGEKGESIAGFMADYDAYGGRYCRGAPANGGGGGNAHNAGGGGGANAGLLNGYNGNGNPDVSNGTWAGAWNLEYPGFSGNVSSGGGRGGYTYSRNNRDALTLGPGDALWAGDSRHNVGGKGGRPLDYNIGKIFLGGGGGAGDGNNSGSNAGANGGGMIYILAYETVNGNSTGRIRADGQDALPTIANGNDAPGGGGGGGTIVVNSADIIFGGIVTANGGRGGNQVITCCGDEGEGPGGGGSGGYIALTLTDGSTVMQVNGGANGVSDSRGVTEFIPNGATAGGPGIIDTLEASIFEIFASGDTVCPGTTATLTGGLTGNPPSGTTIVWYATPTGGTVIGTGSPYVTVVLYNDTVFYAGSCPESERIPVYVVVAPQPDLALWTQNAACKNVTNGSITASPTAGTPPYTFVWSNGQTGSTATGLGPGTYTVTLTDVFGCPAEDSATVTEPPFVIATIIASTDAGCLGGSATVSATGGTPPYSYNWIPTGGTAPTASYLPPGNYVVIATDSNGCQGLANVTINQIDSMALNTVVTDLSCYGGSDGTASVTVTGGVTPYAFLWSNGSTGPSATGLGAGTWSVTVTDSTLCQKIATVTVGQPTALDAAIQATQDAYCMAANGRITGAVSGGTAPYTYLWSPGGYTTLAISGLNSGTWSVTVTDAKGCSDTAEATITSLPPPSATNTKTNVTCNGGADGNISLTVSNGVSPYTYLWSPGGFTASSATGLTAGSYNITVTDAWGCKIISFVTISEPPAMTLGTAGVDATCGAFNGQVSVSPSGGSPPYTYLWMPGGYTSASVTGLGGGAYGITVTDASGCTETGTAVINNISGPSATASKTDVGCNGGADGTATVSASGGTPPLSLLWAPGGETTSAVTGLTAGTYTVTVTDNNGCVASVAVTIAEPAALSVVLSTAPVSCAGGTNGRVTAIASGGSPAYGYTWSGGATSSVVTGLSAAMYTVTVTDVNGCMLIDSIAVAQPTPVSGTVTVTDAMCSGSADGTATVSPAGGVPPYTFDWLPAGGSGPTAIGLSAGSYTVTVRDSNGCTAVVNGTIAEPPALTGSIGGVSHPSCQGSADGSITVTAAGGTPGYSYLWSPGGATGATVTGLSAGTYLVTVTDTNGCPLYLNATLTEPTPLTAAGSEVSPTYCGQSLGKIKVTVTGGTGPYSYAWSPFGHTTDIVTGLGAGTYVVTVTDSNGCLATDSTAVQDIPAGTLSIGAINLIRCYGGSDGSATATMTGGTPPFTYLWSPAAPNSPTITGLNANTFYLTVTDANGCVTIDSGAVPQPTPLTGQVDAVTPVTCSQSSDASITVSAGGGTSPYTYTWNTTPVQYGASLTNIPARYYRVTITDANGCMLLLDTAISDPGDVVAATGVTAHVTCSGGTDGSGGVTATGGTAPYTYTWAPGGWSADTIGGLTAGVYRVTVTDANGCSDTASVTVSENPPVLTLVTQPGDICPGDSVKISANATGGGSDLYFFIWSHGLDSDSTHIVGPTATTRYIVRAVDEFGCTGAADTITVNTIAFDSATLLMSATDTLCFGDSTAVGVTVSGVTDSLTYTWSNFAGSGAGPHTVAPTVTTTYTVTVTNGCGATLTDSVTVYVRAAPPGYVAQPDSGCAPLTVNFSGTSTGATDPPLAWLWNFGDGGSDTAAAPLHTYTQPGVYSISLTVWTAAGCVYTYGDTAVVHVFSDPVADFTMAPNPTTVLDLVWFKDLSSGAVTWRWFFGDADSSTSSERNPVFLYGDSGTYVITLIVTNIYGCTDTVKKTIVAEPKFAFYIPNAFTPNGDNTNDFFFPRGENIDPSSFIMYIFDRWGNEIYETTSLRGWDGTANEGTEVQQQDVYVWLMRWVDLEGNQHERVGHVTLIKW